MKNIMKKAIHDFSLSLVKDDVKKFIYFMLLIFGPFLTAGVAVAISGSKNITIIVAIITAILQIIFFLLIIEEIIKIKDSDDFNDE